MSEEEPQFSSLKDRIAALNFGGGAPPGAPPGAPQKRAPAPAPKLKPRPVVRSPAASPAVESPAAQAQHVASPAVPNPPARSPPPVPAARNCPPVPTSRSPSLQSPQLPSLNGAPVASPPLPQRHGAPQLPPRKEFLTESAHDAPPLPSRARPPIPGRKASEDGAAAPPPLPRRASEDNGPALPPRRPSADGGARRLPPSVPAAEVTQHTHLDSVEETEQTNGHALPTPNRPCPPIPGSRPTLPPRLPARSPSLPVNDEPPKLPGRPTSHEEGPRIPARKTVTDSKPAPARTLPPPPRSTSPPTKTTSPPVNGFRGAPPPIPLHSRPKPKAAPASQTPITAEVEMPEPSCLICRDYTQPDAVAAQYPRASLPREDTIGYLAHVLCAPFKFKTDKARAIFTWFHHNISYDAENYVRGTIPRGQTPEETISSGKAVCEGYSKVYEAIAKRAGVECLSVSGHGKGYGFRPPIGGTVPPRNVTGHAWNAVRLDDGSWKLIDACWGAGHLKDDMYHAKFAPHQFTMPNETFALRHFPADSAYQFRGDGQVLTWGEYIIGPLGGAEKAIWYNDGDAEGLDQTSLEPAVRDVHPTGSTMRFQIPWVCEHWDLSPRGGPLLLLLKIRDDVTPLDYNGFWWYIDVPSRELQGATKPGDLMLVALDQLNGQSARGVTKEEYLKQKGRVGYSWKGIVQWQVV